MPAIDSQAKAICDKEAEIQSLESMLQTTDSLQLSKNVAIVYGTNNCLYISLKVNN